MTDNPLKRLKIDECHYENIVNHMMDLACVTDLDNTICFANQAFSKVLGYSPDQLVGLSVFKLVHPDDFEIVTKIFQDTGSTDYKKIDYFRVFHANGTVVWLDGIRTAIVDEKGKTTGFISVNRDITESVQLQQKLRKTKQDLRRIFETLEHVYWLYNIKEQRLQMISPSCEKLFGYKPSEFFTNQDIWKSTIHPDDVSIVLKNQKLLYNGEMLNYEYRIIRKTDGKVRWVNEQTFPIFDKNNTLVEMSGITIDITEKKAIDQQLQLAAKVFKYSIEGIMVTDLNGNIQMVNTSFENITGFTAEEVIGKDSRILKSGIHTADFYGALWRTIKQEGKWQGEIINRRKDGKMYYQRTTIATIKDVNGDPISYCSIFSDITEAKEAERKLISDLELARQLQKSVLSKPIKNEIINIDGIYLPSSQLAGDMYVWYEIEKNKYGVIIFDIMGHGIASSLVSMAIRSLLRGVITKSVTPESVINDLNFHMRCLFRQNEISLSYFFTAIYAVIDLNKKVIEYVSAGHPPGFLIKEDQTVHNLDKGCAPIGMLPELIIETGEIPIKGRSQIFLYTDGLLDSFGIQTSQNIIKLKELVINLGSELDSSQLLEGVLKQVSITNKRFTDDVAMVAITIP